MYTTNNFFFMLTENIKPIYIQILSKAGGSHTTNLEPVHAVNLLKFLLIFITKQKLQ